MINQQRLWEDIETLAKFTEAGNPYTRTVFSKEYAQARQWLTSKMQEAGLEVWLDAGANLIGSTAPRSATQPVLALGSHTDTVRGGGRFDGIAGVVCALEVARCVQEQKIELSAPLQVIDFLGEEPNDWGISCIGSRAMVGALSEQALRSTNPQGEVLADKINQSGGDSLHLNKPLVARNAFRAFVELHIEQGRVLESASEDVGLVTDLVGIRRFSVEVRGRADHAGTTPMSARQDALATAAELIYWIEQEASEQAQSRSFYLVATVGKLNVMPNSANVVAQQVQFTLDLRSDDVRVLDTFTHSLQQQSESIQKRRGLEIHIRKTADALPVAMDETVVHSLEESAKKLNLRYRRMPSGAGHDAAWVAQVGKVGMVFIPCKEGRSHTPEEWTEPHQLTQGARLLWEVLQKL